MGKKKAEEVVIQAVKGFTLDMRCRGYQFKIGESYTHDGPVVACESGFHSVEYPMDVFDYYAPARSVYAEVEASGEIARHDGDSKIASAKLHVRAALTIPDLVSRAIAWVTARCDPATSNHANADQSASSSTGYHSASSSTGDQSASSSTGDRSASSSTGYHSASSSTGYQSASSSTGYHSASSSTGDRSASSSTGYQSASSSTGDQSASSSTGDQSASSSTGYRSASSSTGYQSASSSTGDQSASLSTGWYSFSEIRPGADEKPLHAVAIATGYQSKARAPAGSAIVLVERDVAGNILHIRASKVGENGVEAGIWYSLKDGEFVKAEEA